MPKRTFELGSVVQLVAGGPQMVVVNHGLPPANRGQVQVAWLEPRGTLRREWLPHEALKLARPAGAVS